MADQWSLSVRREADAMIGKLGNPYRSTRSAISSALPACVVA
jgi:hypothetical protein